MPLTMQGPSTLILSSPLADGRPCLTVCVQQANRLRTQWKQCSHFAHCTWCCAALGEPLLAMGLFHRRTHRHRQTCVHGLVSLQPRRTPCVEQTADPGTPLASSDSRSHHAGGWRLDAVSQHVHVPDFISLNMTSWLRRGSVPRTCTSTAAAGGFIGQLSPRARGRFRHRCGAFAGDESDRISRRLAAR